MHIQKLTVFILLILLLTSCGQPNADDSSYVMSEFEHTINTEAKLTQWTLEAVDFDAVASDGHYLYTVGGKDTEVNKFDVDGNSNEVFPLEDVTKPAVMTYDSGKFYIIDATLNTLFVYDGQFNLLDQLPLKNTTGPSRFLDLEVVGQTAYYTRDAVNEGEDTIYVLDLSTGETRQVGEKFWGYLAKTKDGLMAIQSMESFKDGTSFGFQSGQSKAYHLTEGGLEKAFDFVEGYTPFDFIVTENQFIIYDAFYSTIDTFDLEGNYLHSVMVEDISRESMTIIQMVEVADKVILAETEKDLIIRVD